MEKSKYCQAGNEKKRKPQQLSVISCRKKCAIEKVEVHCGNDGDDDDDTKRRKQ